MGNRKWTEEELNWLREHWGDKSRGVLSRRLHRTIEAVTKKACEIGLGKYEDAAGETSVMDFTRIYYSDTTSSHHAKKLFSDIGVKIHVKPINKRNFYYIKIEDFWRAVKKHPDKINMPRIEENIFGKEPQYIKDLRLKQKNSNRRRYWTTKEVNLLREYTRVGYYNTQLAKIFNRSIYSINRTRSRYDIKARELR